MATITFQTADGRCIVAAVAAGSLLEAARDHDVPGIHGDCGGVGSCGTCHVHVAGVWLGKTGTASDDELVVLEQQPHFAPCSRLCCQVEVTPELNGLLVIVPPQE